MVALPDTLLVVAVARLCGSTASTLLEVKGRSRKSRGAEIAQASEKLSIGDVASRTGLSVSAIRFYETRGLIDPSRNSGGQRRFRRSDIRRLSFVLIAQQLGFSIKEIRAELALLPGDRAPTQRDWARMSRGFRRVLGRRIEMPGLDAKPIGRLHWLWMSLAREVQALQPRGSSIADPPRNPGQFRPILDA